MLKAAQETYGHNELVQKIYTQLCFYSNPSRLKRSGLKQRLVTAPDFHKHFYIQCHAWKIEVGPVLESRQWKTTH